MLLVLSEDHKEHLALLTKVAPSVVAEFGRIALELLKRGTSTKMYEGAARKLGVPVESVQHGIEGLMFLMTESSKHMISEVDFLDSILSLDFGEEVDQILLKLYQEHQSQIRTTLHWLPDKLQTYYNLEWRLDVQLASRSVHQQVVPMVTLHVSLMKGCNSLSSRVLQTDPGTLLHIISTLEAALETMKTSHARRILRNI
ncbi:COMM domain-containing protein 2 [Takifugu rubripes]|uniref:COMM domain containing 2 n=1 Tax=Takifugu rubripes TaxID=31033 RepID=H2SBU3_TAKRU|nr:COMM domain-containing protein 2 [Takifugu rubripes]XP_056895337.1 COMM domain-containing protein 2 [Takifugu flavidus]|eukprot:XP_003973826.1 PREDICTED: COMM domain-containing protein 2 [Takifugu rubripes]